MRPRIAALVTFIALLGCAGGGSGSDALLDTAPVVAGPPESVSITVDPPSSSQTSFKIQRGSATYNGEFYGHEENYVIKLEGVPAGTKVKTGDQEHTVDSDTLDLIKVPIKETIGAFTIDELENFDPGFSVVFTFADGGTAETKAPPTGVAYGVSDLLKTVENGPVTFGTEVDDPNKTDSLYSPGALSGKEWIGKKGKLSELDYIAVSRQLPEEKGTKVCTGYTSDSKPAPDLTLSLKETEVIVYDRRTGAKVDTKVFAPDNECPMFSFRSSGDNTEDSTPPYEAVDSWLRTIVK